MAWFFIYKEDIYALVSRTCTTTTALIAAPLHCGPFMRTRVSEHRPDSPACDIASLKLLPVQQHLYQQHSSSRYNNR